MLEASGVVTDYEGVDVGKSNDERMRAYIRRVIDEAPPLSEDQRIQIAALLRSGSSESVQQVRVAVTCAFAPVL